MVRLSQDWVMRYPLIDWHGSNGNIAGDGPAAARYTEARLSKVSELGLLSHIKENNIDYIPNYDETLDEPVVLPSSFPNLLCNPNNGIGVAMACNWAPHNLTDVINAIYMYLAGEEPIIKAPDFPTGGLIINGDEVPSIISKGRGSVKLQARYKIEDNKIIFYEIPYGETIEGLLAQLGEACEKEEIKGIKDAHDESNKKGVRIVVEITRGMDPSMVAENIYRKTSFRTSFAYNQVALVNKTPTELSLKDCCKIYIEHNKECLIKELNFNLEKAKARLEIVEGLLKALEDIDNVIALIKNSDNSTKAKEALITKYNFTENQAKAILAMRLSSLARLEGFELERERDELGDEIDSINYTLKDEKKQEGIIIKRLQELEHYFESPRRTEVTNIEIKPETKEKKEIIPEDVVVVITQGGDIKRVPKMSFKVQKKANKGMKTVNENILTSFATNTLDTVMIFTSAGKMYKLPVNKIPEGNNTIRGINLSTIFAFEKEEKVQAAINLKENTDAEYVVFFTKNGLIKKTKLEDYKSIRKNIGTQAIKLKEGDSLANVTFLKDEEVIILTKKGMVVRVATKDINPIGRLTTGRKAIKLNEGDDVVIGLPISRTQKDKYLVAGTTEGKAVKINLNEFTVGSLNRMGVRILKNAAAGTFVNGMICDNEDNLLIIGTKHSKTISVSEVVQTPRDSTGRTLVKAPEQIKNLVKL